MIAPRINGDTSSDVAGLAPMFASLTSKQHEVFVLVAENRSSKEIAGRLGVSESAVNQRIEAVRARTGFLPRAQLARAYRHYLSSGWSSETGRGGASGIGEGASPSAGIASLLHEGLAEERDSSVALLSLQPQEIGRAVPDVFIGSIGSLNRLAAMIIIAVGLLAGAMVALGVAQALSTLLSLSGLS
ncbi:helix-turn-helix domain-containing protein [Novosphingobium sp. M1R2S20]|uniref:Helix-turn-helix transcriptional regulator n=1 Tax=Novosphingobium rhizovicinum TaxID=3228928 RepID=A0ABV3RCT8_9SPHN